MQQFYQSLKSLLLIAVLVFPLCLSAQNKTKGNVTGTLTDGQEVLPGGAIQLVNTKYTSLSDMDGKFSIFDVPVGKYVILVKYLGFNDYKDTIEVEAGKTTELRRIKLNDKKVTSLDIVTVKGDLQRGSESKAINMVKTSPRVLNVLSSEGIGKLPDQNAAESIQRLPGVNLQRDKGEGSFVSLRGTPVDWTATLINGDRMPVADEENVTRTFEFQVLPSDLIDYAIISKSVTPDLEGDNIGGSINFITKTAVDQRTLRVDAAGGYNLLAQKPEVKANVLWGDRSKNKRFGYVANLSYYGRYYGAQAYKLYYGSNYNQGINRLELKDYNGFRSTIGANAACEYQVAEHSKISAKFMYGGMTDDKHQYKTVYAWADDNGGGVKLQTIHGILQRQLFTGEISGDFALSDKVKLDVKVASYHNSFQYGNAPFGNGDARNGYYTVEFANLFAGGNTGYTDMDTVDNFGHKATTAQGGSPLKLIGTDNPYGHGDNYKNIQPRYNVTLNPRDFYFSQAYSELNKTKERDPIVGSANLAYNINNDFKLQFGFKVREKEGSRDISNYSWKQNIPLYSDTLALTRFQTQPFDERGGFLKELGSPYKGTFFPFLTNKQQTNFVQQLGDTLLKYPMNPENPLYVYYIGSSYRYNEQAIGTYVMLDGKIGKKFSFVGGLRLEETIYSEFADTLGTMQLIDSATNRNYYPAIEQHASGKYLAILPSLNTTYAINDKMNLRFAFSRSFHRPNFTEIKPGYAQFSLSNLEYNFGNPNLKPTYSLNFDVSYEYYWGNKGMFSIGAYYKYVTDHIFATISNDIDPSSGIVIKSYENAKKSDVVGAEASITRKFDFFPKAWGGLGVNANFSYSFSRMQVPGRPSSQAMPEQTPIIYNLAIFYEKYGFNARLGLNYTGPYLLELNLAAVTGLGLLHTDASYDVFMGENYALDFLVSYDFKKHYTVYLEMNNLLDSPYVMYRGERSRPIITEYYRQRGQIGFKYNF